MLYLESNYVCEELSPECIAYLSALTHLCSLTLISIRHDNTSLSDGLSKCIPSMLNLHTLYLNDCEMLHSNLFSTICEHPSITSLSIPDNLVTDDQLFPILSSTNLRVLNINYCHNVSAHFLYSIRTEMILLTRLETEGAGQKY
jgi:hypothetical protein